MDAPEEGEDRRTSSNRRVTFSLTPEQTFNEYMKTATETRARPLGAHIREADVRDVAHSPLVELFPGVQPNRSRQFFRERAAGSDTVQKDGVRGDSGIHDNVMSVWNARPRVRNSSMAGEPPLAVIGRLGKRRVAEKGRLRAKGLKAPSVSMKARRGSRYGRKIWVEQGKSETKGRKMDVEVVGEEGMEQDVMKKSNYGLGPSINVEMKGMEDVKVQRGGSWVTKVKDDEGSAPEVEGNRNIARGAAQPTRASFPLSTGNGSRPTLRVDTVSQGANLQTAASQRRNIPAVVLPASTPTAPDLMPNSMPPPGAPDLMAAPRVSRKRPKETNPAITHPEVDVVRELERKSPEKKGKMAQGWRPRGRGFSDVPTTQDQEEFTHKRHHGLANRSKIFMAGSKPFLEPRHRYHGSHDDAREGLTHRRALPQAAKRNEPPPDPVAWSSSQTQVAEGQLFSELPAPAPLVRSEPFSSSQTSLSPLTTNFSFGSAANSTAHQSAPSSAQPRANIVTQGMQTILAGTQQLLAASGSVPSLVVPSSMPRLPHFVPRPHINPRAASDAALSLPLRTPPSGAKPPKPPGRRGSGSMKSKDEALVASSGRGSAAASGGL